MSNEKNLNRLNQELETLPPLVHEYVQAKSIVPYSLVTLYEYAKEFRRFFEWLVAESVVQVEISYISISDLEKLKKEDMDLYKSYLMSSPRQGTTQDGGLRSHVTIQRAITALRSLFHYLANQTEDNKGKPYLSQNVMLKIDNVKTGRTLQDRSRAIEKKILIGSESVAFLEYINHDYEATLTSHQAVHAFRRNKERDLAIIALFLGTGIRLSELVNMKISDLDIHNMEATVIRKGGFRDTTMISSMFMDYITTYYHAREKLYQPDQREKSLFLTTYKQEAKRIDQSTVEKLVSKYSASFKTKMTPHKLRHTVGTQLYKNTNSLLTVSHQLGQTGTSATSLYTHIVDKEKRDAINDLWQN